MTDLAHYIGDDLTVSATGDLQLATDTLAGQQRVLRRLLTPLESYIWHLTYGAGLPAEIGKLTDIPRLTGLIREQIFKEAAVSHIPEPAIVLTQIQNGVSARIQYVDTDTKQNVALNFNVED